MLTHGPDPVPSGEIGAAAYSARSMPICVDNPAAQYHNLLIYVHASDKTNRGASFASTLRDQVNRTNAHLRDNAVMLGGEARYKFACDASDTITLQIVGIPATSAEASFSRIASDLRAKGYTSNFAKYWVWYDGSVGGGIAGQGTVHNDNRPIVNNGNNFGGDFAMTYGQLGDFGVLVLAHENGHNLGAVQLNAPHSSGGFHCNDGRDTMCYADGGSKSNYTSTACSVEYYDCNNDDYFHIDPPAGNYLATHWNLGNRMNRFFDFGPAPIRPPVFTYAYCNPMRVDPGRNVTCTFSAADDESIFYSVDWDDGSNERIPAEGAAEPGILTTRVHTWSEKGTYNVTLTATDTGTPPMTATRTIPIAVDCAMRSTGWVFIGLAGVEVNNWSTVDRPVPVGCQNLPFRLTTPGSPTEMDVCWYNGPELLECHREVGDEAGLIPWNATTARLILMTGFNAYYDLKVV